MVTALDLTLPATALAVLTEFGKNVTFSVTSGGTNSPSTGAVTGATTTTYTVKAYPYPYEARYVDGDVVQVGDAKLILAASGLAFTPAPGQSVTIDAAVWRVIAANAIYSGELVAAWELQVRR